MNDFLNWYSMISKLYNLDPNPYDPRHYYDWQKSYNEGNLFPSNPPHWSSQYKQEGHPNLFVGNVDTRTGQKIHQLNMPELNWMSNPNWLISLLRSLGSQ